MPVMSGSTADGTGRNVGRRHGTTRRMLLHTRRRRDHPRGPVSVVAVSLWRRRSSSSIVVLSLRWRRLLSSRLLRLMVVVVVLHLDSLAPSLSHFALHYHVVPFDLSAVGVCGIRFIYVCYPEEHCTSRTDPLPDLLMLPSRPCSRSCSSTFPCSFRIPSSSSKFPLGFFSFFPLET
jgi:hypothetical protein